VDAVVALTRETADEAERFGIDATKIAIIGNGVDVARFRPRADDEREQLKRAFSLRGAKVVLFVGRLVEAKNVRGLLDAWLMAVTELGAEWRLVIVGRGPLEATLTCRAAQSGHGDSVVFAGHQPNVEEWMAAADVYVSTSWHEGLSNTMLEAMASALPVVVTRVSGAKALVGDDVGRTVATGDMQAVARELVGMAHDASRRREYGRNGRRRIERRFTVDFVAQEHLRLYSELLHRAAMKVRRA